MFWVIAWLDTPPGGASIIYFFLLHWPWDREISMRPPAKPRGKQYNAVLTGLVHRISINSIDLMNALHILLSYLLQTTSYCLKRGWNSTTSTTMIVRRGLNRKQRNPRIFQIFTFYQPYPTPVPIDRESPTRENSQSAWGRVWPGL